MYSEVNMISEISDHPPGNASLRWLNRILMGLCWMTVGTTFIAVIFQVLSMLSRQSSNSGYVPSFGSIVGTVCGMFAIGGITALFVLGLTKLTQIWAEVLDNGRQKTDLLATLLTDPTPHE